MSLDNAAATDRRSMRGKASRRRLNPPCLLAAMLCALGASALAAEPPLIRAGSELDFRPYCFTDKDGQPTGLGVDLLQAVADRMALRLEITPGPWDQVWSQLVAGEIDVLPVVARTPGREPLVEFSLAHTETFDAFFVRQGRPPIRDIAGAAGKEIAVPRSDAAHHQLIERGFAGKVVPVRSIQDGLRLVAEGIHDAFLCSKMIGVLEAREGGIDGIAAGPPIPDYKRVFSFAVRKGNTELLEKLNQGLAILKADGTYDRIYRRWLGVEAPRPPKWHESLWAVLGLIAVLALVVVAWRISREAAKWDERLLRILAPRRLGALPAAWRYVLALAIVVAATALRVALVPWLGTAASHNFVLVAAVIATILLGGGPGLLVMACGHVAFELFVLGSWPALLGGATLARLGVSMVIGLFVVFAIHAARVAAAKARENASRLEAQREQLARSERELKRSNEDLQQFAYITSHDLQEPLRMVNGFLRLLEDRYRPQLDDKARQYIDFAVEGAGRMSQLLQDLLDYGRLDRRVEPIQPADSRQALAEATANLRAAAEEAGATITFDGLPTVLADHSQLMLLFQNLVGNAIKFRDGGRPCRVHVGARKADGEWEFSVRDNGIGIPKDAHDRIFVLFQRLHTRQAHPGTGIGLAICKRIVERHGGRIWLESVPGEGSTFFFTLPEARGA